MTSCNTGFGLFIVLFGKKLSRLTCRSHSILRISSRKKTKLLSRMKKLINLIVLSRRNGNAKCSFSQRKAQKVFSQFQFILLAFVCKASEKKNDKVFHRTFWMFLLKTSSLTQVEGEGERKGTSHRQTFKLKTFNSLTFSRTLHLGGKLSGAFPSHRFFK